MGINFGAVQSILTDILGMSKVSARWVPRMLTDDQKRTLLDICRYLLSHYDRVPMVREKSGKNETISRSGKSQGILSLVREI